VTKQKHLKQLIRARMTKTQESYSTARRHILHDNPPEDYLLRGGIHPETATIANVLANRAIVSPYSDEPLTEAMVLGIGGGLGAGYILWEFKEHNVATLVFGFRNQWQYPARWIDKTCTRLGISASIHETGGRGKAASQLTDALARGIPAIAWIDQQTIGYRHLPEYLSGWGGHPVVVYALQNDVALIDDRNLKPLNVAADVVSAARARVTSYKNRLVVIDESSGELDKAVLREAVVRGIEESVAHLNQPSDSFSLPAWRKWARLMTDTRNKKAWPRVFEKGAGLFGALVSAYESVAGGTLRNLYASFLDEAAKIVEASELEAVATRWRDADRLWHRVAQRALPDEEPFTSVRRALDDYRNALKEGDGGAARGAQASRTIWELREELDTNPPWSGAAPGDLFDQLSGAVQAVYEAEVDALAHMEKALAGLHK
jgi:hypothetical protein